LGTSLHAEHPHLEPLAKKEAKEAKLKGTTNDLDAIKGAIKFSKGDEPNR